MRERHSVGSALTIAGALDIVGLIMVLVKAFGTSSPWTPAMFKVFVALWVVALILTLVLALVPLMRHTVVFIHQRRAEMRTVSRYSPGISNHWIEYGRRDFAGVRWIVACKTARVKTNELLELSSEPRRPYGPADYEVLPTPLCPECLSKGRETELTQAWWGIIVWRCPACRFRAIRTRSFVPVSRGIVATLRGEIEGELRSQARQS